MKHEYNFLSEALQIMNRKWMELEITTKRAKIAQLDDSSSLHAIRMSKEYLSEFLFTIGEYLDTSMDYSPYLHTCNYILKNFETFEEMDEVLFATYGDDAYTISPDQSALELEEFKEKNAIISEYVQQYVDMYTTEIPSVLDHAPEEIFYMVFHLTILIMLELELDFVSFFQSDQ